MMFARPLALRTLRLNDPCAAALRIVVIGGALDTGSDDSLHTAWHSCRSQRLRQAEIVVVRGFYTWRRSQLEQAIEIAMATIDPSGIVIGFSFGGLVARAALIRLGVTAKLVTIATQHQGHLPPIARARDALGLERGQTAFASVGFERDAVVPLACTRSPGAQNYSLPGGHPSLEHVVEHLGAYQALAQHIPVKRQIASRTSVSRETGAFFAT
jgi:hypothetical protein